MPPLACPRCHRTNPADASFCYFDGADLRSGHGQAAQAPGRLAHEFFFPSGRRCRTYDELSLGCREEWVAARDLLRQGVFRQFFTSIGRMDLAKAAQEAMAQKDADIGLTRLVGSLPGTGGQGPKLDLHPRRLLLGSVFAGEIRQVQLTVSNQGQGTLQGTLTVAEGGEWLRLSTDNGRYTVQTAREQQVTLQVDTRGLAAAQTYGARLTVVTNGGVVEVPVRMDLAAHPFPKSPFQGARTPREMAERMRANPKAAVPLLESGEVSRWFVSNGWNYPIRGTSAKGVAGVQQFFESMGLAKAPVVQLSQREVRLSCKVPEATRAQVALQTTTKKWVYANVTSDAPWLKVLTPTVSGPQQALIAFEVDSRQLPRGRQAESTLQVVANAGQKLNVRVLAEAQGAAVAAGGFVPALVSMALACLLLRLLLVPVVDLYARPTATAVAAARTARPALPEDSPAYSAGAWLKLPWFTLFLGNDPTIPEGFFGERPPTPDAVREFRDAFVSQFIRTVVVWTGWLGAVGGVFFLFRRGSGWLDVPWGLIGGGVLGVMGSATLACLVLVGDLVPHLLWDATLRSSASIALLPLWVLLAPACWAGLGALAGFVLGLLGPWGRMVLAPVQYTLAGLFRMCGLPGAADYCAAD